MRNLKKVLSLALALVMLLGMMVVGAGAATSFTDDDKIQNQEAVAVLVGMGIMKGREDNSGITFQPEATLTRAEAAKMIAQLDLGVQAADALKANGTNPFTDVWADHWAAGAIDYCVEQGYITGDGAGHFYPGRNVKGVEFAIMLLRLLGYDAKIEGLVGDKWAVNGAALARKAGLTTGVLANNVDMTRDGMAQMAFNALTASMVEYEGMDITIGDVSINARVKIRTHSQDQGGLSSDKTYDGKTPTPTTPIRLCEERFPDLKLDTGARDGFKREYSVWTWKNVDIAGSKVLVKADAEFTAKTTASDVSSAINGAKGARLDTPVYVNGKQVTTIAGTDVDADLIASWTENGRQVLVYLNETDHKQIKKVVVVDTFVAQVNSVGSDSITLNILSNTEKTMEPANAKVSALKNSDKVYVYNQTNLLAGSLTSRTVKATGFTAGDLVTYTAAYNNDTKKYTIVADDVAMLSDPVTGTLTAWKGSNLVNSSTGNSNSSFTVDSGDPYSYSVNNVVVDSDNGPINIYDFAVNKSEINVYVDKYGYAIYVSGVEVAKNYAAVIGMGSSNQYGSETRGVTLLLPDGTTVEVTAKMSKDDWAAMTTQPSGDDKGKNLVTDGLADIVTYTVDDKGIYSLSRVALPRVSSPTPDQYTGMYKVPTAKPVFANGKSEMKIEGTYYYTTNRTIFMVGSRNTSDNTYSYSVYTGYANAPSIADDTTVHGIAFGLNRTLTRQIDVVYIDASNLSNATGSEIYFAFNKNVAIDTTSNGSFVTVPAVVDGKVEDIMISATISKNWDGTGEKQLRNVTNNGLYVIDTVVRNDAGIITNCTVKAKGEGNDILKAFPAGKQGVVKAGYGVIGFGQANEGDNIFWAYTENSKGYYIDKDYKTITETAIGSFATDRNDYVWANGDSVNKKVDTLFVVEVEGNDAPIVPSDNEVVVTVDIDAGVKSVTVGTTKLTEDGNVNVTKNTATDVTVELNDGYKVSKVTGAGNNWTSGEKFTIKTSTTDTLKIETASTKGFTLTLKDPQGTTTLVSDSSGVNGKATVFVGNRSVKNETNGIEQLLDGLTDSYNVAAGQKVTIKGASALVVTSSGMGDGTYVVDDVLVTVKDSGQTIEFTMPEDDFALVLNADGKMFVCKDGTTEVGAATDKLFAVHVGTGLSVAQASTDTNAAHKIVTINNQMYVTDGTVLTVTGDRFGEFAAANKDDINIATATAKAAGSNTAGVTAEVWLKPVATVHITDDTGDTVELFAAASGGTKFTTATNTVDIVKNSTVYVASASGKGNAVLVGATADDVKVESDAKVGTGTARASYQVTGECYMAGAFKLELGTNVKATIGGTDYTGTVFAVNKSNITALTVTGTNAANEVVVEKVDDDTWFGDAVSSNGSLTADKAYIALTKVTIKATNGGAKAIERLYYVESATNAEVPIAVGTTTDKVIGIAKGETYVAVEGATKAAGTMTIKVEGAVSTTGSAVNTAQKGATIAFKVGNSAITIDEQTV